MEETAVQQKHVKIVQKIVSSRCNVLIHRNLKSEVEEVSFPAAWRELFGFNVPSASQYNVDEHPELRDAEAKVREFVLQGLDESDRSIFETQEDKFRRSTPWVRAVLAQATYDAVKGGIRFAGSGRTLHVVKPGEEVESKSEEAVQVAAENSKEAPVVQDAEGERASALEDLEALVAGVNEKEARRKALREKKLAAKQNRARKVESEEATA